MFWLKSSLLHAIFLNVGGEILSTTSPALFTRVGKEYLQLESYNRAKGNGKIALAFCNDKIKKCKKLLVTLVYHTSRLRYWTCLAIIPMEYCSGLGVIPSIDLQVFSVN